MYDDYVPRAWVKVDALIVSWKRTGDNYLLGKMEYKVPTVTVIHLQ